MNYGVDVSENQAAALPWPAWYATGYRVAVARASIGFRDDANFARYVAEAYAAGFTVGAYHAILGHQYYDPTRQAREFLELIPPQVSFLVLDDEAPGVSDADVLAWESYVFHRSPLPLILYGNWQLAAHVAALPVLGQLGVWWAGYPTAPNLTTVPPWPTPRNVPAGLRVVGWQYAGDNGRLPPYTRAIDLSVWYELPGATPPPPVDTLAADIAAHARGIIRLVV
jgi:GH25 family lysozyme M1 (1,4-beta-N-acetylmuramidase)